MKRLLLGAAGVLVVLLAAMALDDARFWWRYAVRLPGIVRLAPAAQANAIPTLRATIAGGKRAGLRHCAPDAAAAPALAQADRWMMARRTEAFLVWHNGCLVHEHYATGTDATPRAAGAMAKSLMALVAGRAIRLGVVKGLDQPVADHLTEWRGDARRAIRYRDLLGMHAGLTWYRQTANPFGDFQRIILAGNYAPRILQLPSVAPPGQLYDYSAWTYDLLGIALARAGHHRYEQLASAWIFKPLGLGDARLYVDHPGGTVHGNCCLFDRADDWVRLGALLIAESGHPAMLPDGFVAAMRRGAADQPNYGLGVWLGSPFRAVRVLASAHNPYPTPVKSVIAQSVPFTADDVIAFEGVEQNKTWVIPSHRLVIVRFGKAPNQWDDAVVPNLLMAAFK